MKTRVTRAGNLPYAPREVKGFLLDGVLSLSPSSAHRGSAITIPSREGRIMRASRRSFVLVLTAAVLMLGTIREARGQAPPAGEVIIAWHVTIAPTWFDPSSAPPQITPFGTLYAIHDALARPMPNQKMGASLAESWTESPDGKVYEFKLRRGLKFHNGDPVTTEDVKWSFERYKGAGAKVLQERVQQVEIVDPLTVRFHLKEPWPDFMTFYGTTATAAGIVVPKAPCHDKRLRQAVNYALDRKAINEVACLGFCPPTTVIVPRVMDFALQTPGHPYDPQKAKQLLTEAGYPNGLDAGEFVPTPPFFAVAETAVNFLNA